MTAADGWIEGARRAPSPNCDDRPPDSEPDLLVIHCISLPPGRFGGPWIDALFQNRLPADAHPYFPGIAGLRVSAHLLVRRDGELVQYVPLERRAWHAGVSRFQGRKGCNDFSIGIELEGDLETAFTRAQYQRLTEVTREIQGRYPAITRERITGHQHIAPERKQDPGPLFDWDGYIRNL